ncbi:MAG: 30S ribosomal protein S8 [Candidatus Pacebacteria bacterium]|jgi:small subunit ribosomal protein S8|nr:30S ribosomal protein S8 [Candidatus Paceibacterota bacterium]
MDKIANMLTTMKNGAAQGKEFVLVPYSKYKSAIATKLFEAGYIDSYAQKKRKTGGDLLQIGIRYVNGKSRITDAKRVSRLSLRTYRGVKELRPVKQGTGIMIISTPKGILSDKEARDQNVGGEILFKIW